MRDKGLAARFVPPASRERTSDRAHARALPSVASDILVRSFIRILFSYQWAKTIAVAVPVQGVWQQAEISLEELWSLRTPIGDPGRDYPLGHAECNVGILQEPVDVPITLDWWLQLGENPALCWREGVCNTDFAEQVCVLIENLARDVASKKRTVADSIRAAAKSWVQQGQGEIIDSDPRTVDERIRQIAAQEPQRPAIVHGAEIVSYGALVRRAHAWASRLRDMQVTGRVGVLLPRGSELLVALLGVLEAGLSYLPLDPDYPEERLAFMLCDSSAKALICLPGTGKFAGFSGAVLFPENEFGDGDLPSVEPSSSPQREAYCIYTSGSTGKPKGVPITHRALSNYIDVVEYHLNLSQYHSMLGVTTVSFDPFVTECWGALAWGVSLVLASESDQTDPGRLGALIQSRGVDIIQTTPSRLFTLLADPRNAECLRAVRLVIACGESVPPTLVEAVKTASRARFVNCYGPTEVTVYATFSDLEPGLPVTIGRPFANTWVGLVDAEGLPTPPGGLGEICVRGPGLSSGYVGRPDLTADRFRALVLNVDGYKRMTYCTGDLGNWDGNELLFAGRIDHQVKIRGYRVEIPEIENRIQVLPGVVHAVVKAFANQRGELCLVAFTDSVKLTFENFQKELAAFLPGYMIPEHLRFLSTFPHTGTGKIDRGSLCLDSGSDVKPAVVLVPPEGDVEATLVSLFETVFEIQGIGVAHSFSGLGGHSLLATKIVAMARANGLDLRLPDLLAADSIRELARRCSVPVTRSVHVPTAAENGSENVHVNLDLLWRDISRQLRRFSSAVLHSEISGTCPLGPAQSYFLRTGEYDMDGLVMEWADPIDLECMVNALSFLVNKYLLLRSRVRGTPPQWEIHTGRSSYPVPFVDLSGMRAAERDLALRFIEHKLFNSPYALARDVGYRLLVVKSGREEWVLYAPFSHLIFDAVSEDLLRRDLVYALANAKLEELVPEGDYDAFVAAVDQGYRSLSKNEVLRQFPLPELARGATQVAERLASHPMGTGHFELLVPLEPSGPDAFHVAVGLLLDYCRIELDLEQALVGVMLYGRVVGERTFFQTVGACIDIVPVMLPTGPDRVDEAVERLQVAARWVEQHGANGFMLMSAESNGPLTVLAEEPMIVFNYQGYFDSNERSRKDAAMKAFADVKPINVNFTAWASADAVHVHAVLPYIRSDGAPVLRGIRE